MMTPPRPGSAEPASCGRARCGAARSGFHLIGLGPEICTTAGTGALGPGDDRTESPPDQRVAPPDLSPEDRFAAHPAQAAVQADQPQQRGYGEQGEYLRGAVGRQDRPGGDDDPQRPPDQTEVKS